MSETDSGNDVDVGTEFDEAAEPSWDRLVGVLTDGVIGAIAGLVGTVSMIVGLIVGQSLGVFRIQQLSTLSELLGLDAFLTAGETFAAGVLLFFAAGMITWPLLFAATESYLPGSEMKWRGIPYGTVLWTGFVLAFYEPALGSLQTVLYAVITLLAHWSYGFTLGAVFDYLTDRPDTLV